VNSREKNAWADGRYVIVTTAMLELARSDDEVAFIIAHEMAHNILGHSHPTRRRNGIFGGISRVKKGEIEADSFAVHLMSGAGYRPLGGISFLQNARRRMWWNVSLDHPGFDRRIRVVSAAMHSRTQAKPSRPSGS
jgi:predicted Zn-dependent protease